MPPWCWTGPVAVTLTGLCDEPRASRRRLEKICLRAMAAEPADRYATADDLARDLDRYVRRPRWCVGGATTVALCFRGRIVAVAPPGSTRPAA